MPELISVIIPVRNEATCIGHTLDAVRQSSVVESIVIDGGSTDGTRQIALAAGARVMEAKPGRARQMNLGVTRSSGGILLFLHGDTLLPPEWDTAVRSCMEDPEVVAGAFAFSVDGSFPGKRLLEWGTNLRARSLQLPYGDQALFMRRSTFDKVGGYPEIQLMEDYELVRKLHKLGRIRVLEKPVRTSGRRWHQLGFLRTFWVNQMVIAGHLLGVDHQKLAEFYRKPRKAGRRPITS